MSNATLKCMWLAVVLLLSVMSSQANPNIVGPIVEKSNKEVIIINYDQFATSEVSSLVEYAKSTYNRIDNARITIKDYSKNGNSINDETLKSVVTALQDVGVSGDNIVLEEVAFTGAADYFSISIGSATQVQ